MANMFTNGNLISLIAPGSVLARRQRALPGKRRRMISPQEGRAIEILGRAIEYLSDEFAVDCLDHSVPVGVMHPRLQAIELLMALNREIYLNCPEAPGMGERLWRWLRFRGQEA